MTISLDTSIVVAVLRDRPPSARARLGQALQAGDAVAISAIVLVELSYGAARSGRRTENMERLQEFFGAGITVWPFSGSDALAAGVLREQLDRAGQTIGPYDILIAAQALRLGATLVTSNLAEFRRVPGLQCEDWTA